MKWNKFNESERIYPDEIVNKLIKGFPNATGQLLELVVETSMHNFETQTDFVFRLLLVSHRLENYRFKVATFGYNVEIYPVSIVLDEQIYNELFNIRMLAKDIKKKDTEQEFEELMIKAFESERFQEVVSGLLKISQKPDLVS